MSIKVNGEVLETDEDGYIQVLSDWSHEVAEYMAAQDDIVLTADH